ncbi:DUF3180 domain-containing protein [Qaidamihabitans albus]|uniref:DUF3180 domain-containing protein n=1 Tax=Qaidamihabitans albus TaxID=2795733 RepID=UPI0018F1E5B6|nr:DUF3180 domain-containing protein [Qaidamihabitans albus]
MHYTRPRELLIAAVLGFGLVLLLFEVAYESMPSLPAPAGITLAALAVVEVVLAFVVRRRIRSRQVVTGVEIARAAMLAKASSLLGALMFGAWLSAVVYLAPKADRLTAAAADLPAAIIGSCCAAALIGAALWLEYCCRTPDQRDQDPDRRVTG